MVEKSDKFDEWRAIRHSFPFQSFPCNISPMKASYNQFIKVLFVKLFDMLDSSNVVRLFHHQSFALYGIIGTPFSVCTICMYTVSNSSYMLFN